MSRPIVLSNGELHVGLNDFAEVHDFYYPYVGLENHAEAAGLRHKIGVWVEGSFSWLDDESWTFSFKYHDHSMIGETTADNKKLALRLEFTDCVDVSQAAFLRNIHIINMADKERDIRLFMHQVFVISNSRASDTCQYMPEDNTLLYYKGRRAFVISAEHEDKRPFDEYSIGICGIEGREGTFRDAEDGSLQSNHVEHGRVDSAIGIFERIAPLSSKRVYYWIAAGKSPYEAKLIHDRIKNKGVMHSMTITAAYWREWLKPSEPLLKNLPQKHGAELQKSLLVIKSHIDKRGAVMASLDTTMLNYSRDSYGYCWPRDAAYALWPLLRLGYTDEPLNFFAFCKRVMHTKGYLYHKYQADGALGSSWHPYVHKYGKVGPPIQTDETAIVLFLVGQYYRMHKDPKFLKDYYISFVEPMANFLAGYTGNDGLPLPSYDLWEQTYLTTTYTTALTYASLLEASELADSYGRIDDGARWRSAAEAMKGASSIFYNPYEKFFYKGFIDNEKGVREFDATVDISSLYGVFMFGLFDRQSEEFEASVSSAKERLSVRRDSKAFVRYEHDDYYRDGDDSVQSNVWAVTSLWMAQIALEREGRESADKTIDFVLSSTKPGYLFAEQMRADDFEPTSVAPLIWSHAEFVSTLLDIVHTDDRK